MDKVAEEMFLQSLNDAAAAEIAKREQASASPDVLALNRRCCQIADRVVPEYRVGTRSHSCCGTTAKRWSAAFEGAALAIGGSEALELLNAAIR
ncbi:hypothetical protein S2M10_29780 [Sphingomonas sp. S2M10]|uniref:hypothetical protein n=1 Tax=Sphingomonas sp. S2M10 TaxID=2705010 RepID=UPI0014578C5B|nr:hypothetical protein [Sphingomonas sp. S2M10]NLS27976.1 hypothetical protein [Sphingomonas sp. S2M10]